MAYGRISSYQPSGLKHFLPLNNLFLSPTSCLASAFKQTSTKKDTWYHISIMTLQFRLLCYTRKSSLQGDSSMSNIQLEFRNPFKLMCIRHFKDMSGRDKIESSCFLPAYPHWVRGGDRAEKCTSPLCHCTASASSLPTQCGKSPSCYLPILPSSLPLYCSPTVSPSFLSLDFGGFLDTVTVTIQKECLSLVDVSLSAQGESLCSSAVLLHPLGL